MKKYIIKNCPNLLFKKGISACGFTWELTPPNEHFDIYTNCQDISDCILKQIVKLCIGRQNICTECPSETCFDCENVTGGELATEIIDLLEIEEVNE